MIANLDSLCIILQKLYLFHFAQLFFIFIIVLLKAPFFYFHQKTVNSHWATYLYLRRSFLIHYFGQHTNSKMLFSFLDIMHNNDITLFFYRMFAWKLYEQTMKRRWIPILFYILNHCSYSQEIMIHSNVYLYTDNNISQHHLWCADIHLRSRQICKMVITTIS